ncbi:ABC transporter ATP-binding protein [Oceanobacillus sp. FSL K6-2867]|uniref:ABC transporter ATP-binding protein n=1 Tax=Oceanobacillus sp. FSL K6-2867 TaxID=2954748 RepID=UPI0030DA82F5
MNQVITTKDLSLQVGYFTLKDITVQIPKGKITSIVGSNGSGKSTLLKLIARLLEQDSGHVIVNNKRSKQYKAKEFAKVLAMMPQSKQSLPNLTVEELIAFGRYPYKKRFETRTSEEDRNVIQWAMEVTNTKKYQDRMFLSLSGGEQQKVRIAMALAQQTNILLLDEPTTYLDIAHQFEVMDLLQEINQRYGIAIIMVNHELQQAATYSDYLIAMKQGEIVAEGTPENLLTSTFLEKVYNIFATVNYIDGYPIIVPNRRKRESDEKLKAVF